MNECTHKKKKSMNKKKEGESVRIYLFGTTTITPSSTICEGGGMQKAAAVVVEIRRHGDVAA